RAAGDLRAGECGGVAAGDVVARVGRGQTLRCGGRRCEWAAGVGAGLGDGGGGVLSCGGGIRTGNDVGRLRHRALIRARAGNGVAGLGGREIVAGGGGAGGALVLVGTDVGDDVGERFDRGRARGPGPEVGDARNGERFVGNGGAEVGGVLIGVRGDRGAGG